MQDCVGQEVGMWRGGTGVGQGCAGGACLEPGCMVQECMYVCAPTLLLVSCVQWVPEKQRVTPGQATCRPQRRGSSLPIWQGGQAEFLGC